MNKLDFRIALCLMVLLLMCLFDVWCLHQFWYHCYKFTKRHFGRKRVAVGFRFESNHHLRVCLLTDSLRCVNKLSTQSIALGDTPWLHSSICPRHCTPQPPLCLLTMSTTNMQPGRRLTHLDYLPPPLLFPHLHYALASSHWGLLSLLLVWLSDCPTSFFFSTPHIHAKILRQTSRCLFKCLCVAWREVSGPFFTCKYLTGFISVRHPAGVEVSMSW